MMGLGHRTPPREQVSNNIEDSDKRRKELAEREDAKRRVAALDVRVDVLTRRMNKHEKQPHP